MPDTDGLGVCVPRGGGGGGHLFQCLVDGHAAALDVVEDGDALRLAERQQIRGLERVFTHKNAVAQSPLQLERVRAG